MHHRKDPPAESRYRLSQYEGETYLASPILPLGKSMLFVDKEKLTLLEKCTLAQLKEVARTKNIHVEPALFNVRPRKDDYVLQLYDAVSVKYLKGFLSEESGRSRRTIVAQSISKSKVLAELKRYQPTSRSNEAEYERDLLNWARGRFGNANVTSQYSIGRTRIDLVIGGVGVELKAPRTARQLLTLRGQVAVYKKEFGKNLIVVLLHPQCDPSLVSEFIGDMKKQGVPVVLKG